MRSRAADTVMTACWRVTGMTVLFYESATVVNGSVLAQTTP
jgi:hypothetical protein